MGLPAAKENRKDFSLRSAVSASASVGKQSDCFPPLRCPVYAVFKVSPKIWNIIPFTLIDAHSIQDC
jgi:hypothetical protein